MSDVYAGDNTNNPSSVTMPENGDPLDAASVRAAAEGTFDKVDYALSGTATFQGAKAFDSPVTFNDEVHMAGSDLFVGPTGVAFQGGAVAGITKAIDSMGYLEIAQIAFGAGTPSQTIPSDDFAWVPVELPEGASITAVSMSVVRSAGTPTTEARISLIEIDAAASATTHGPQAAAAGVGPVTTTLDLSGGPVAYSKSTKAWWIYIEGEYGGADVTIRSLSITYSLSSADLQR